MSFYNCLISIWRVCTNYYWIITWIHQYLYTWHDELIPDKTHIVISPLCSPLSFSVSCVQAPALSRCLLCHEWDVSRCHRPGPIFGLVTIVQCLLSHCQKLPPPPSLQSSRLRYRNSLLSQSDFVNRILLRLSYLGKVFNWCGAYYISWSSFEILLQNFDSPCYTNFLMGTFEYPGWAGGLDWLHWQQYLLISSKSETPR